MLFCYCVSSNCQKHIRYCHNKPKRLSVYPLSFLCIIQATITRSTSQMLGDYPLSCFSVVLTNFTRSASLNAWAQAKCLATVCKPDAWRLFARIHPERSRRVYKNYSLINKFQPHRFFTSFRMTSLNKSNAWV